MEEFFSKPYFEKWLEKAGPEIQDWFAKETDFLEASIEPNSTVLDVGCGFGRHMAVLAVNCRAVYGIDNEYSMVRKAKDYLKVFKNTKVLAEDAANTSFDDNLFDYVICMNNTFGNFLDKKEAILNQMKRVCKKGGKIIISVYSEAALKNRIEDYKEAGLHIVKTEGGTIYTEEGLVSEQFSVESLRDIFRKTGLFAEIKKMTPISYLCIIRN